MPPWASETITSSTPAARAPSTTAFRSPTMSLRPVWYSPVSPPVWLPSTIPLIPSMSMEMKTLLGLSDISDQEIGA